MTSPIGSLITRAQVVDLAVAGDRGGLADAITRAIADGDPGQQLLHDAFIDLVMRPFTGDPTVDPTFLFVECCPHPGRTTASTCDTCATPLPRTRTETTMPDPGEPFDLLATDLPVLGDGFAGAHELPDLTGRDRRARRILTRGTVDVRGELLRVDAKANTLLALAGVLLGLAVIGASKLQGLPFALGCLATALVLAAVVLLALAMMPNPGGGFGFVFYARTRTAQQVLAVAEAVPANPLLDQAGELRWLSIAVASKYRRIRYAVALLLLALGVGVLAAALTLWAR